ncbi:hypothetical protein BR93DRAFT_362690 [Coniochaeta sp. PMI_546]|nr:hypothetical protein BR93DRAFT_362690 [Coniochaeta sp. PMI_546]
MTGRGMTELALSVVQPDTPRCSSPSRQAPGWHGPLERRTVPRPECVVWMRGPTSASGPWAYFTAFSSAFVGIAEMSPGFGV